MSSQCAFCGRSNDTGSRFCIDCGKPMEPAARASTAGAAADPAARAGAVPASMPAAGGAGDGRAAPAAPPAPLVPATRVGGPGGAAETRCPSCRAAIDPSLPFCPKCGKRTGAAPAAAPRPAVTCPLCGGAVTPGVDLFCGNCGTPVDTDAPAAASGPRASSTVSLQARPKVQGPVLSLLGDSGEVLRTVTVDGELTIGRTEGTLVFEDDAYLSPVHAQLVHRDGQLWVRDLGSRNRSWVFLDGPARLADGDVLLVGSQLLCFRRLGYPGPQPPEADATRRLGSLTPTADIALLAQLRADGSTRDALHLSPGRTVIIGREQGDWVFPYDPTMSGRHAEVRSEDSEFVFADAGSRNGVAVAVRGERVLRKGQRVLLGDQILRVETV